VQHLLSSCSSQTCITMCSCESYSKSATRQSFVGLQWCIVMLGSSLKHTFCTACHNVWHSLPPAIVLKLLTVRRLLLQQLALRIFEFQHAPCLLYTTSALNRSQLYLFSNVTSEDHVTTVHTKLGDKSPSLTRIQSLTSQANGSMAAPKGFVNIAAST